ncbi:MAG: acyltransferase [Clostridia bacterium]|nr:acyltransferase [Clostridia bacterium]
MKNKPDPEAFSSRVFYLDALRAIAVFLVIVNHTNSYVFKASAPWTGTWCFSMAWYYISKPAVPLFVMISGACLLPKIDSYRRIGLRALRMAGVLILFSYAYDLWNLWLTHWDWRSALDIPGILAGVWEKRATDSFWYLYLYLGLLIMLPLLQRLASALQKKDLRYLILLSFGLSGLWPLLAHYAPALRLPPYFDLPLLNIFVGLLFAGHYMHHFAEPKPWHRWACLLAILGSAALATALTGLEAARLPAGVPYWFMDERTTPSITILLCAAGMMYLPRCWRMYGKKKEQPQEAREIIEMEQQKGKASPISRPIRAISALGRFSFGIYLLQDFIIAETRYRVFEPLRQAIHPVPAALLWELLVYGLAAAATWGLTRLPGLRRLL